MAQAKRALPGPCQHQRRDPVQPSAWLPQTTQITSLFGCAAPLNSRDPLDRSLTETSEGSPSLGHETCGRRLPSAGKRPGTVGRVKPSAAAGLAVRWGGGKGAGDGGLRAPHPCGPGAARSPSTGISASSGARTGELVTMLEARECAEGNGAVMGKSPRQLSAAHPLSLRIYVQNPISRHRSKRGNSTRPRNGRAKSVLRPAGHCWGSGPQTLSGQREAGRGH